MVSISIHSVQEEEKFHSTHKKDPDTQQHSARALLNLHETQSGLIMALTKLFTTTLKTFSHPITPSFNLGMTSESD
jgi:hypothetical protein